MAHLVPKPIIGLPFVDRAPNPTERPDQRRIEWIRNGDCLGAAEHAADNSGELNRGPVQVQKNVITNHENDMIIESSLQEIIERVNSHDDVLGEIGDDNLATKVQELEEIVEPFDAKILKNTQDIFLIGESVTDITTRVGKKPILDIHDRTLFADVFWVKKEIGNWVGRDVNDNENPLIVEATGLKARLVSQGLGISANERRIQKLESDWVQSDVGALTSEIHDIRTELGNVIDAPVNSVYKWIKSADSSHEVFSNEISKLKDAVGGGTEGETLDQRITKNSNDIETNQLAIAATETNVDRITTRLGDTTIQHSLEYNLQQASRNVTELQSIVGMDEDSGLQKGVQDIRNEMGTDDQVNSIRGRISTAESKVFAAQQDVATLDTKVGNNTVGGETGIYKRLVVVESVLNDPIDGLTPKISTLEGIVATKLDDAPSDGNIYGRKDKTWERIVGGSGGGIQDAPKDNKEYVRFDETWKELFSTGIVLPEGQKIEIMKGADKRNVISRFDDTVVIGESSTELTLSGKVKSFSSDTNFAITSSDVTNANVVSSNFGVLRLGDPVTQTILPSYTDNHIVVEVDGGVKHEILHEGNYREFLPLVVRGGFNITDNTTPTPANNTESTVILLTESAISTPSLTTVDVSRDGSKLMFTDRVLGHVVNAVVELRVQSTTDDTHTFELVTKDDTVMFSRTVEHDEWSPSKSAVVRFQCPAQLIASDELIIRVKTTTGASDVTVTDGMFYVYSI